MRTIPISLRVTEQEAEWLDHFAAKVNRTRANFLQTLVRERLIELAQPQPRKEARKS